MVTEDQVPDPNGILFSPDYKKLYVISTGKGPGDTGPGGKGDISVFDVGADNKLSNQKLFTDCVIDGVKCGPDGMRCDVDGNVWCSSNAGRAVGYSGVTMWNPAGKLIGRIQIPEIVANISFGGPKRNRLFIAGKPVALCALHGDSRARPGLKRPGRRSAFADRRSTCDSVDRRLVRHAGRKIRPRHDGRSVSDLIIALGAFGGALRSRLWRLVSGARLAEHVDDHEIPITAAEALPSDPE